MYSTDEVQDDEEDFEEDNMIFFYSQNTFDNN